MDEMKSRGYKVDELWYDPLYRGKKCEPHNDNDVSSLIIGMALDYATTLGNPIYSEHNDDYLTECLENLKRKGINL
jgi:uncharacterized protein (TIGR02328 family)